MTTQEVADKLTKLCSEGNFQEPVESLYSPDIVSMEAGAPPGGSRESKGIDAIIAKGKWWAENHEVHSVKVEGPLVTKSHFAVVFKMDVTFKPQSRRFTMEEVAVYKVVRRQDRVRRILLHDVGDDSTSPRPLPRAASASGYFRRKILRISSAEYPFSSSARVRFGNFETLSRPSGVHGMPSKSLPIPIASTPAMVRT